SRVDEDVTVLGAIMIEATMSNLAIGPLPQPAEHENVASGIDVDRSGGIAFVGGSVEKSTMTNLRIGLVAHSPLHRDRSTRTHRDVGKMAAVRIFSSMADLSIGLSRIVGVVDQSADYADVGT